MIRVDDDVYEALVKIKGEIEQETGRTATMNDAVWKALGIDKTVDLYRDKPHLRKASEKGFNARVLGDARQANPYRGTAISNPYRRAWFEGWDLAEQRSKGHAIYEEAP